MRFSFGNLNRITKPKPKELTPSEELTKEYDQALDSIISLSEKIIPNLLEEIRTDIEQGSIGTIVGIDRGGRIPALIFREIINRRYKELGYEKVATTFFRGVDRYNGAGPARTKALRTALEKNPPQRNRKVLIIDDTMDTGKTNRSLVQTYVELGYEPIVLILSKKLGFSGKSGEIVKTDIRFSREIMRPSAAGGSVPDWEVYHKTPVFLGDEDEPLTSPFSGVTKEDRDDSKPHAIRKIHTDPMVQEIANKYVRLSREKARTLSDKLYGEYIGRSSDKSTVL